jgi:hypothetical protein
MRRPPSLSEGSISIGNYNFLQEPLTLVIQDKPVVKINQWEETIVDYSLRFLLHISLISFFETLFFFKFVSIDEDRGITEIADFYTNKILNSCADLNSSEIGFLNSILTKIVNVTNIQSAGLIAASNRSFENNLLYVKSWSYFGGIFGVFLLLSCCSILRKYKIRWSYIILENIVFVSMLGFYELLFFLNIIKQYNTLTPQEITMGFVDGLETTCGLLN